MFAALAGDAIGGFAGDADGSTVAEVAMSFLKDQQHWPRPAYPVRGSALGNFEE